MQLNIRSIHIPTEDGKSTPNIGKLGRDRAGEGAQGGERKFPQKLGDKKDGTTNS